MPLMRNYNKRNIYAYKEINIYLCKKTAMQRLELKNQEFQVSKIKSYFEHNEEARFVHRLHGILLFASKPEES
jgi:hypothetical protein